MSSRSKARRAVSEADRELHMHLARAERALVHALDVARKMSRERRPEFAQMRKNASVIEKELGQAQSLVRKVGLIGEPAPKQEQALSRAQMAREERKKARQEAQKTETLARRILASLEAGNGS